MNRPTATFVTLALFGCLGCVTFCGCGGGGPPRYDVTGTVTFEGRPVPIGSLILNADHKSNNKGPQGRADIRNGTITTKKYMGTVGGPQWLQITGFDGQAYQGQEGVVELGRPLFPIAYKQMELPRDDVSLVIRVTSGDRGSLEPNVEVEIAE